MSSGEYRLLCAEENGGTAKLTVELETPFTKYAKPTTVSGISPLNYKIFHFHSEKCENHPIYIILPISIFSILFILLAPSPSTSHSPHSRPDPVLFPTRQTHNIIFLSNTPSDPTPPSIAYLLCGSKGDVGRILRLLFATYHPRNHYILHLDLSAPQADRENLALKVQTVPIFRAAQNVDASARPILPILRGRVQFLLRFTIFFTLSFLPKDFNFVNHSSYIGWKQLRRLKPIIVDPGLYLSERTEMFYATQKRDLPNAHRLFTGHMDITSRGLY
ncbi:Beta-glucuronosyltransferase GlcAT14A [Quillaja saponaria]|uniref:Beta-glucuronosyltransferase GlcAT14A n=1 Tax=Quillaja saponaria TaxID=32244 RepID=A0AAD7QE01_QUISA|nr:Beta-glucuronosyltransferase GlcAT14A [Quillaja saponaria]